MHQDLRSQCSTSYIELRDSVKQELVVILEVLAYPRMELYSLHEIKSNYRYRNVCRKAMAVLQVTIEIHPPVKNPRTHTYDTASQLEGISLGTGNMPSLP